MSIAPKLFMDIPIQPVDGDFGTWKATEDYIVWSASWPTDALNLSVLELYENGVVRIPDQENTMHTIRAGTPHHIEHLFGYWRLCDADTLYFRTIQDAKVYYLLIIGGKPGAYNSDTLLWVCPKCAMTFNEHRFETGKSGWRQFWETQLNCVRDFNSDLSLRKCPKCEFEHPLSYGFYPQEDNKIEAEARNNW